MSRESIYDRVINPGPQRSGKLFMTGIDLAEDTIARHIRKGELLNDQAWMEEAFYALRMEEVTKAMAELIDNPKSDVIYRLLEAQADAQCGLSAAV